MAALFCFILWYNINGNNIISSFIKKLKRFFIFTINILLLGIRCIYLIEFIVTIKLLQIFLFLFIKVRKIRKTQFQFIMLWLGFVKLRSTSLIFLVIVLKKVKSCLWQGISYLSNIKTRIANTAKINLIAFFLIKNDPVRYITEGITDFIALPPKFLY